MGLKQRVSSAGLSNPVQDLGRVGEKAEGGNLGSGCADRRKDLDWMWPTSE